MRSRATAYSVLTFLLFAFLPPAFSVPPLANAGPFADAVALQSPSLADLQTRQAVVSGLAAILTPSGGGGGSPPPAPAVTSADPVVLAGARVLEARRVLRRSTEAMAGTASKVQASTRTPAPAGSAMTRAKAPVPPATAKPLVAAAATHHRVGSGDTLWSLARRYGVSVDAIVAANSLPSANQLRLGQVLTLPSAAGNPSTATKPAAAVSSMAARSTPPTTPSAQPASVAHRVQQGDTLSAIAQRYGVSVDAIVAANGLASRNQLRLGQVLTLPVGAAKPAAAKPAPAKPAAVAPDAARSTAPAAQPASISHRVQQGDTLSAIARRYGTNVGAIVAANDLPSAHRLRIGQSLTVPVESASGRAAARLDTALAAPPAASTRGFIWPTRGLLSSRFGWRHRRHHDGIDLAAPHGSPIYAARAGRVVFAGWYYGYGRAVILNHGDGMTTLYGHASSLVVRTGQSVRRGQLIARVGSSGNSTGSHLHFEVRIGGRAINPLRYLN